MSTSNLPGNGPVLRSLLVAVMAMVLTLGCASNPGDSRAKQGAKSGAAVGAGIGLLLGVLSGDSGVAARAIAVGAASGAASGAYEGWRQDQDDERTRQITQAIRESNQSNQDAEARQREQLTRFLGVWQMSGWLEDPKSGQVNVSSQVNGTVQMSYFVELAWIDFEADGIEQQVWGTTTLGYDSNDGYGVSTRFNTLPEPLELGGGQFDSSKRTFTWADSEGVTTIRFDTPDRFILESVVGGKLVESYRFDRN